MQDCDISSAKHCRDHSLAPSHQYMTNKKCMWSFFSMTSVIVKKKKKTTHFMPVIFFSPCLKYCMRMYLSWQLGHHSVHKLWRYDTRWHSPCCYPLLKHCEHDISWLFYWPKLKVSFFKCIIFRYIRIRSMSTENVLESILRDVSILRLRQNGWHFPDNIFKCIFLNEHV